MRGDLVRTIRDTQGYLERPEYFPLQMPDVTFPVGTVGMVLSDPIEESWCWFEWLVDGRAYWSHCRCVEVAE